MHTSNLKQLACGLIVLAVVASPIAHAGDPTTRKMAEIILSMDAKPSSEAKTTLEKIAGNVGSTETEQTLAKIMLNVDGKIRPHDKPIAMKVMLNPAASPNERSIAKALLRYEGSASDKVKSVLNGVVK